MNRTRAAAQRRGRLETFAKGELIATGRAEGTRALCDECTVLMPTRRAIVGREGVYLA